MRRLDQLNLVPAAAEGATTPVLKAVLATAYGCSCLRL